MKRTAMSGIGSLALVVLLGAYAAQLSAEVLEWRNVPIAVVLIVGEERVLAFPDHVQVGVPSGLNAGLLRTQSTGGTVLWLARAPFETQRLQVRLLNTGHVMLFDVTAVEAAHSGRFEPIHVTFPATTADTKTLTPVVLTRFAAQQLYAPRRLVDEMPGIRRLPMGVTEMVELYRGERIAVEPLASWQSGGLYVTAVKLTNQGKARISLDPRKLRGRFVSAAFQHNTLGAAGSLSDATCVYLVTDRPFTASLFPSADNAASAKSED